MPEGPEVEVVMRAIMPVLRDAVLDRYSSRHHCFPDLPVPLRIASVHRHGKWIILSSGSSGVMLNLGMSGRFREHGPVHRHARWIAMLDAPGGGRTLLQFVDPRCMGRLRVLTPDTHAAIMRANARTNGCIEVGLGPDALGRALGSSDHDRVTARWRAMLAGVPFPIKAALMMQHIVAGIGNIYASEACHLARIHPTTPARDLSRSQVARLALEIPRLLQRAVRLGGTSIGDANSFRSLDGSEGRARAILRVYGRAGEPCDKCGRPIRVARLRGRSTFWCATCQTKG